MTFERLSIFTSILTFTLFASLLLAPELILGLMDVACPPEAAFLARRASMIFLGLAVMSWLARKEPPSATRRALRLGLSTLMFALAILGTVEFARGFAGPGIFLAVVTEVALAGAMLRPSDRAMAA